MIRPARLISIALLFTASPAIACEPGQGQSSRIATNIELVQNADLIVLGRVASGPTAKALVGVPWANEPGVSLDFIEALKGKEPQKPVRLFGAVSDWNGRRVLPAPTPLTEAHPNAYEGGCVRTQFAVGALVVAMFKQTPTGYRQLSFSMARQIEDVPDRNSLWVKAVRYYTRAAVGDLKLQQHTFSRLRTRLSSDGNADDAKIADDIEDYLRLRLDSKYHAPKPWLLGW